MKTLLFLLALIAVHLAAGPTWSYKLEPGTDLHFSSNDAKGDQLKNLKVFDLKPYRGKTLTFQGMAKLEQVSRPPRPDLGGKFMFVIKKEIGTIYPGCQNLTGTFDWTPIRFSCLIPADAEKGTLVCGLQSATGSVRFRDIHMTAEEPYPPPVALPADFRCEYSATEMERPAQRGFMSPFAQYVTLQDIRDMAALGANLVRWQLTVPDKEADNPAAYAKWLDHQLNRLKQFLPECERLGVKIIIDMHVPPGKRQGESALLGTAGAEAAAAYGNKALHRIAEDDKLYQLYLDSWKKIAARFQNEKAVIGYDLINEPVQLYRAKRDYLAIQYEAAKEIRKIDPETPIYIESNNWCAPDTFVYLHPLPLKNLIYQVHMYDPGAFSHQGLRKPEQMAGKFNSYPGVINGVRYDKAQLRRVLAPVREFQKKYGAKIFVGEFSATRWSPGAERYLADQIELFEEFGWSWTYHAFRESDAWDAEIATTEPLRIMDQEKRVEARKDRDSSLRLDVLKKAFLKNIPGEK